MKNFYNEMNEAKEWFDTLLNSLNQSGVYFTNSENTKQDFIKIMHNINPENIIVTPLGVSEEFYRETSIEKINKIKGKYNIPQNKKYLFSLCTLEPRKNIIFAVKNFVEFIKQNNIDDFIFVIGGAHWDKFLPILEKEIDNCEEYKSKILKIGYVEDEDVPLLYNGAEMFVYPSLYEGFGMPILEAMKCGCPVICSNTSSMPEVIGDCGIQIDPTKDEEMIQALEKMYHDREFRQVCIEKGIERAKEFSWEKSAKIMIDKMKEEFYKEDNN
jgi:glycosyltransferase involved in cell wall biosynthesis